MTENENNSRIKDMILKENYLLGLSIPTVGTVFFRVVAKETIPYIYDEIGDMAADEWKDASRIGLAAKDITDLLKVNDCDVLYQVFVGISPSIVKSYRHYPVESMRGNLEETNNYTKSDFGFVDGFESPFNDASPVTETWIPVGMKVGYAWHNPSKVTERVMVKFTIIRYRVEVVRDADLIHRILTGRKECRLTTMGGVEPIAYNTRNAWDIEPVPLGASIDEITSLVSMRRG